MSEKQWFKHDSDASEDPKLCLLIEQFGPEGIGIYWLLVEILSKQKGYVYPLKLVPSLARRWNTTNDKVMAVINGYDLFRIDNDLIFYSESLIDRMSKLNVVREKRKKAVNTRWEKEKQKQLENGSFDTNSKQGLYKSNTNVLQMHNTCNTSRVEKSRVEKSRVDISNDIEFDFDRLKSEKFVFNIFSFLNSLKLTITTDELNELLDAYIIAMKADNDVYRNENDYRAHFRNWVKIQVEKKKPVNAYSGLNERKPLFDDLS